MSLEACYSRPATLIIVSLEAGYSRPATPITRGLLLLSFIYHSSFPLPQKENYERRREYTSHTDFFSSFHFYACGKYLKITNEMIVAYLSPHFAIELGASSPLKEPVQKTFALVQGNI